MASAPLPARAAPPRPSGDPATDEARKHYDKAIKFYDLGRWDEAISEFEKAYDAKQDPNLLFNLAQAYRRKGDIRRSLELYKNYLRKVPETPFRKEVESRIASLTKQVEAADQAAAVPPPLAPTAPPVAPAPPPATVTEPPAPSLPPVPAEPAPTAPAPDVSASESPPSPEAGRGLRIAGLAAGGVAVASLVTGAIFGARAASLSDEVAGAPTFDSSKDDSGKSAESAQWVFYGIGAAAAVAGGVLYYLGVRARGAAESSGSSVSWAPTVGPQGAGVSARVVF